MGRTHFPITRLLAAVIGLVASVAIWVGPSAAEVAGPDLAFFDSNSGQWTLDNGESFYFGIGGDDPLLCDWNGDGIDTVGLYRSTNGFLYLRNSNNQGIAEIEIFFGVAEDMPVCGDWDGDGVDTIGIYRPSLSTFFLRNANSLGFAEVGFTFGDGLGVPLAGDWDGNGVDTVGLWQPWDGLLRLADGHSSLIQAERPFGSPGDRVVISDWDGDGRDSFGVYRLSTGRVYLDEYGEAPGAALEYEIGAYPGWPAAGFLDGGGPAPVPVADPPPPPPPPTPTPTSPPPPSSTSTPTPTPVGPPIRPADGSLFLWDTVWQIAAKADRGAMEQYLDRLAAAQGPAGQNITGFWFSVANINQDINTPNGFGHTFGSFDNPNDDYLADIDTLLFLARDRGLRAGIVVAWDGPNQFAVESAKLNGGNAYSYGTTIASRWTAPGFSGRESVAAWVLGGDTTNDCCGGENEAVWAELVRGIRDAEAANSFAPAPVLFHTAPGHHMDYVDAEWLDAHSPQTGHCYSPGQAADWLRELDAAASVPVWGNGEMRYEEIDWDCNGGPISPSDVLSDMKLMQELGFMSNFLYGFDPRWNASTPGEVGMSAEGVSEGLQRVLDEPGLVRGRLPL